MRILRRVGSSPRQRGSLSGATCPDLFELASGDFAVIGRDATDELRAELPQDAGVAGYERIVVVPRRVILDAARELRDT